MKVVSGHLNCLETILEGGWGEEKKKESERKRNYFGNLMSLVGNGKEKVGRREDGGVRREIKGL